MIENTPDAVLLVDRNDIIRYANQGVLHMLGYGRDDIVGQPLTVLQPEALRARHRAGFAHYLQHGVRSIDWQAFETAALRKDGTEVPVEIAFGEVTVGGERLFAGFIRDNARRDRAERRLLRTEQRLESILSSMKDCVWSVAPDGKLLYLNPATEDLIGRPLAELFSDPKLWFRITHPDDRALAASLPARIIEHGAVDVEYRIVRPDGAVRRIRCRGKAVRDGADRIVRLDGVVTDITDAKQHEERILRLSRVHAVLSGINSLTVRERDRQRLFEGACQIAVEQGQLRLAWIGMVGADERIRPVAQHGLDDGYFATLASYAREHPDYFGPTARAIAERRAIVINDIAASDVPTALRAAAAQRGLRAVASLPLVVAGNVTACMSLYAGEAGFFDDEELALLDQLANDLSYTLEFIAREEQLHYASSYDAVTGLPNRRLFLERLDQFTQVARQGKRKLAVLLLDLAGFKSINDLVGHAGGDEVLKQVGERLLRFAGAANYLGRVGGDRFAALVPDLDEASQLTRVLQESVWERVGRAVAVAGQDVRITAKLGVALFPDDGEDAATLLRNAEAALKRAKQGGERYLFYTREMTTAVTEKLRLETQLRHALERNEFQLHYQPKVDLRTGAVSGAEALLRWNSPERGLVMPLAFVPMLEETGLIVEVGHWVVKQAIADHRAWLAAGLPALPVAVNVAPLELRQAGFVDSILRAIDGAGPRGGLELEMTESSVMTQIDASIDKLARLREKGVLSAIDDFGTGYSSLAYLARLPVSAVKIDRSFVIAMPRSPSMMAIVSAIIALARSMNLKVVAEGVDSTEQLKFLQVLRCDEMQGYLFSPPLPAAEFAQLVRSGRTLS